jgi:hypothetical protein
MGTKGKRLWKDPVAVTGYLREGKLFERWILLLNSVETLSIIRSHPTGY